LNKNPKLKAFLKGGEVDTYEGIEVEWIRGKKAVMHIYDDGNEVEEVALYELTTREEIVKKMEEKGFHLKSRETVIKERTLKNDLARMDASSMASMSGMSNVLMAIGAVATVVLFIVRGRKKRKR